MVEAYMGSSGSEGRWSATTWMGIRRRLMGADSSKRIAVLRPMIPAPMTTMGRVHCLVEADMRSVFEHDLDNEHVSVNNTLLHNISVQGRLEPHRLRSRYHAVGAVYAPAGTGIGLTTWPFAVRRFLAVQATL